MTKNKVEEKVVLTRSEKEKSIIIGVIIAFVLVLMFKDLVTDVRGYETDKSTISELLGGEVLELSSAQVKNIVDTAKAYANIAATGNLPNNYDNVVETYLNQFMGKVVNYGDLAATVMNYETYLYGDKTAMVEITFRVCGETVKAYAIVNSDNSVLYSGFEDVFYEQYKMYEALIGDGAINPEADAEPNEYYNALSEEEKSAVEGGEYSSMPGDAEN